MAIYGRTPNRHKQKAFFHFTGIRLNTGDLHVGVSYDLKHFQRMNKFF